MVVVPLQRTLGNAAALHNLAGTDMDMVMDMVEEVQTSLDEIKSEMHRIGMPITAETITEIQSRLENIMKRLEFAKESYNGLTKTGKR